MEPLNTNPVRFEPFGRPPAAAAQDKLRRETAQAQPQRTRLSTSLETNGVEAGPAKPQRAEFAAAAKAFEAVFLRQMIGSMRQAKLAEDDLMGGGQAADTFRNLQDSKLADAMSGSFGIAQMLEKQFEGLRK